MRSNVVQLRELLREKFPGLRMTVEHPDERVVAIWPTGLAQVDEALGGGLPKGGITELLCPTRSCGSALLLATILKRASEMNQIAVLIDGQDSFDPASMPAKTLRHLLWVRCHDAAQAMKAADFVLRDANLPFVALDLTLNSPAQLRKIPATTWHRFRRIIEQTATAFLVITRQKLVSGVDARLVLQNQFNLESIDESEEELLKQLHFEVQDLRLARQPEKIAAEAG